MQRATLIDSGVARPAPAALLELLKPVTWFPPMWAFLCGVVASGVSISQNPWLLVCGVVLAGPLVCGASQVVNDWYDREVDAINEPHRPIPSGRVPGQWGFYFAMAWTLLAFLWSLPLGIWVSAATVIGLLLAWAYSAPPVRLKQNGWWGATAVGISYEGLAWVTGTAAMLGGATPSLAVLTAAGLYSIGAHGIMTLNDFKAIEGDRALGIRSLPVQLGPERAAQVACAVMLIPQLFVIALLITRWDGNWQAAVVTALVAAQLFAMHRMLRDPEALAPWYNATGVTAYVSGMMITATALRGLPL